MSQTPDPVETPDDGVEDFDAFWNAQKRQGRRVRLFGEVIELPAALPLQFEMEARRLQRSKRDQDVTRLVGILFGEDALETYAKAGMDIEQFRLLLAWAPRAIAGQKGKDGQPLTLAEVAAELAEADAKDSAADPT